MHEARELLALARGDKIRIECLGLGTGVGKLLSKCEDVGDDSVMAARRCGVIM